MCKREKNHHIFLLIWFIPLHVFSQTTSVKPVNYIEAFSNDPCFRSASLSMMVFDLDSDTIVTHLNPDIALPPASTLKILTTAAGLSALGPQFRFRTEVGYTGYLRNDTLYGDLIIKGFGDPTLGSSYFTETGFGKTLVEIGKDVSGAGITYISGRVIGDGSHHSLSTIPRNWPFQDMGNYYGAFCAGLNFHDNLHTLDFIQKSVPGLVVDPIRIKPEVPSLQVQSLVTTGGWGSGDQAYIMGAPFQSNRFVQGTIPPGKGIFSIKGSLPDPALFCAYHVRKHLLSVGIQVTGFAGSVYVRSDQLINSLSTLSSPILKEIVKVTNQKSINLFAEGIGLQFTDQGLKTGDHPLITFWEGKGVDMTDCRFSDYSGLAPDNMLTSRTMVNILRYVYHDMELWPAFHESLAVMGKSGTLQYMLKNTRAEGKIFAKSGLIKGVRTYAGYLISTSGRWYAFSLMTLNPSCDSQQVRKKLEQLLETLYLSQR